MRKLHFDQIEPLRKRASDMKNVNRLPLTVVLDNVRSLYNVGSIFRTADAVLLGEVILTGYTPRPPRKEITKTALGATETVPWRYVTSPLEAVVLMKKEGLKVYALELTDLSTPLHRFSPTPHPIALILGNEVSGISPEVLPLCDGALAIPMRGSKHSLNVAVAFGVAAYHFDRIWSGNDDTRISQTHE